MLSSKKVAAFDLDGTLAESKLPPTPGMATLLCRLASKIPIIIISGGSYSQFKKQLLPKIVEVPMSDTTHLSNFILMPTNGSQCFNYDKMTKEWFAIYTENFPEELM